VVQVDYDRDLAAELLDRGASTFGFGLREQFAGGSVDQHAMRPDGNAGAGRCVVRFR
jgi:hypothetical protein